MTFDLTTGAIWGIGVGAFMLALATGISVIVLFCRLKQRRQLARIFSASERRLSGYPGGHFSITDEDVARTPGTRRVRSANHAPLRASQGWTAISSRESLPRRPVKTTSKQPENKTSSVPVWPLPPRLTRSTAAPLGKLKASLSSPPEKVRKPPETPSLPDTRLVALNPNQTMEASLSLSKDGQGERAPEHALVPLALKPKPLFHEQRRSISAGLILQRLEGPMDSAGDGKFPGNHQLPRPHLPRSASLCSQHSGMVPNKPIPPLPFNFSAAHRLQKIKTPTEASSIRASGNSLLSGHTSILDDCISRTLSQAGTDVTSMSAFSPCIQSSQTKTAGISNGENNAFCPSTADTSSHPLRIPEANEPQLQSDLRKSSRASIGKSLPRSASSGLSLSLSLMAPGPSRNASNTSLHKDKVLPSRTPSLMVPETMEAKGGRRGKSPASPLRNSTTFDSQGDLKVERKFLSTLQVISGNEGNNTLTGQPDKPGSSSGENTIFQWDPVSPMQPGKPSAIRDRAKGHLRQTDLKIQKSRESNVQISDISLPTMPLAISPVQEKGPETPEHRNHPSRPQQTLADGHHHALPRPPTRVTFDPQIISNTYPKLAREVRNNNDSPTLSIFRYNQDDNNSSLESLVSSPSPRRRSPTRHRQSGSNPNRLKPVFSNPGDGHWSIMNFESSFATSNLVPDPEKKQPTNNNNNNNLSPQPSSSSTNSRPYSFTCPIPPPDTSTTLLHPNRSSSPTNNTNNSSNSPIRGPRAAPPHRRTSPIRGIGKSPSSSHGPTNLRKSIMALRRKNSEAYNSPLQQHRNYLAITNNDRSGSPFSGSESGSVFKIEDEDSIIAEREEGEEDGDGGVMVVPRTPLVAKMEIGMGGGGGGGMDPRFGESESEIEKERGRGKGNHYPPESPGMLYDPLGFLRE